MLLMFSNKLASTDFLNQKKKKKASTASTKIISSRRGKSSFFFSYTSYLAICAQEEPSL